MSVKGKSFFIVLVIVVVAVLLWIKMIGKTFHPTLATKFLIKEEILSMLKEENENRVFYVVKTDHKLITIDYEKIGWFLYQCESKYRRGLADYEDIVVEYLEVSIDTECFAYGVCRRKEIKEIEFIFEDATSLKVTPNEEGIFLAQSNHIPLDAKQILGYTDNGETVDLWDAIMK